MSASKAAPAGKRSRLQSEELANQKVSAGAILAYQSRTE